MNEQFLEHEPTSEPVAAGPIFAGVIAESLSSRLAFHNPAGVFEEFLQQYEELPTLSIRTETVGQDVTERATVVMQHAALQKLARHESTLRSRNAWLAQDSDAVHCEWTEVTQEDQTAIRDGFTQLSDYLGSEEYEPAIETFEATDIVTGMSAVSDELRAACEAVCARMPSLDTSTVDFPDGIHKVLVAGERSGILRRRKNEFMIWFDYKHSNVSKLSVAFARLSKILDELTAHPEAYIASKIVEQKQEVLALAAEEQVNELVLWNNMTIVSQRAKLPKQRPAVVVMDHESVNAVAYQTSELQETENKRMDQNVKTEEKVPKEPVYLGEHPASLPWVHDGELTWFHVVGIQHGEKRAFMARTIEPALDKIAGDVRARYAPKEGQESRFDALEKQLTISLAEGQLQRGGVSSVKPVRSSSRSKAYQGVPIWYVSANDMRIYFTHRTMGAVFGDALPNGVSSDDPCLMVLSETDKLHQVEVLRSFTGESRRSLRNGRAGAI